MSRLTSDVDALNDLLSNGLVAMLGDVVTLFAVAVIMLLLNWQLTLVMFAVLPVVAITSFVMRTYMRDSFRQMRTRLAKNQRLLTGKCQWYADRAAFQPREASVRPVRGP